MSLYLNRTTGEYPRYQGDVELNPDGDWVEVEMTNPPLRGETQILFEGQPELVDGRYSQVWNIREMTSEELDVHNKRKDLRLLAESAGLTIEQLRALIVEQFPFG